MPPFEVPPAQRTAVVVLGMHRSGTSALAGTLSKVGCSLPAQQMPKSPDNEKGFFESIAVFHLNNRIFHSLSSSWDDWSVIDPTWFASSLADNFKTEASEILRSDFNGLDPFVLKDPRICRLLPLWHQVLEAEGYQVKIVHIHRNPLEAAYSLQQRDHIDLEMAQMIWLRHVLDAEFHSRQFPRYFTSFTRLLDNWQNVVSGVEQTLKLRLPNRDASTTKDLDNFLTPSLKHNNVDDDGLYAPSAASPWVQDTFEILERWAKDGDSDQDHQTLDAIRLAFAEALPLLSRSLQSSRAMAAEMNTQKHALSKAQKNVEIVRAERNATQGNFDKLSRSQDALQKQYRTLKKNHETLTVSAADRLDKAQVKLDEQETLTASAADRLDKAQVKLDEQETDLALLRSRLSAEQGNRLQLQRQHHKIREQTLQHQRLTAQIAKAEQACAREKQHCRQLEQALVEELQRSRDAQCRRMRDQAALQQQQKVQHRRHTEQERQLEIQIQKLQAQLLAWQQPAPTRKR